MTIAFDAIPSTLRYPGAYVEIDGSQAGLSDDIPAVLLVGQKLADGTAPAGEIVRVSGVDAAEILAGEGSMLARMVARYRAVDPTLDLYMLPYSDLPAGVKATGSITVDAAPTAAGVLALYIAGQRVQVGVTAAMTAAAVAAEIALAVTAMTALPVSAAAVGAVVTLTSRHAGTCGTDIDLRLNVYGETAPAGLGLTVSAMTGGSGNPDMGDLPAILGTVRYWYVALGINDAATLAAWHTEARRRYLPPVQAGFRMFAGYRGDYDNAADFGDTKNHEHLAMMSLGLNPTPTWEAAAVIAAAAGPRLYNSPVQSLEGVALPGLIGLEYHDWTQANSLLYKGMSILQIARDGSCTIKRLISMYQFRADGSADDAYLDINTAEVMERIRHEQRIGAIKRFTGTAAARSPEGYRPGLRITTVDDVRAYLLSLYQHTLMREYGWVQDYDWYKAQLVVEQAPDNPSRFNFLDKPVLLSPFYILAGRAQFRKAT